MSLPIPTQSIPPSLQSAISLLDGVLLRDDVPMHARPELADVYGALLDVRPPYPPVFGGSTAAGRPWPAVIQDVIAALDALITDPEPLASPSVLMRYASAIRTLRGASNDTPGRSSDCSPVSTDS